MTIYADEKFEKTLDNSDFFGIWMSYKLTIDQGEMLGKDSQKLFDNFVNGQVNDTSVALKKQIIQNQSIVYSYGRNGSGFIIDHIL